MPEDFERETPRFVIPHTDAIEFTPDGTRVEGRVLYSSGMTEDEVKEELADHYGDDAAIFHLTSGEQSGQKVGKRVFGFSNWSGSKWEPTGPKGNPNLN